MTSLQEISHKTGLRYRLVPPDGGWGYFVTLSFAVMGLITNVPQVSFGLIFGKFMASIGDETSGTTLVNGIFYTVQSFTGLAASFLLQRYSYRKVGLLGAILYATGAFAIIFVKDLTQMIIAYGILEGLGFGLLLPAAFSAFNSYFDRRMNLMMGVAQTVIVFGIIIIPPVITYSVKTFGFRGTAVMIAVSTIFNFPMMGILQPVKWHMKKIAVIDLLDKEKDAIHDTKSKSLNEETLKIQIQPLPNEKQEEGTLKSEVNLDTKREDLRAKPRFSVISLGNIGQSLGVINDFDYDEAKSDLSTTKCLDLGLLKDPKYLNISFGVALSYTSDVAFFTIIPLLLNNSGFNAKDTALSMMIYFGSDVVSRISISVVSALCSVRNRYVFLAGSASTAVFRVAFVMTSSQKWKMAILAVLGFMRCLIQTPLSLVFAEEYKDDFDTAFPLYMAVCGLVSIIVGFLTSYIKSLTQDDEMVVHVLTGALLIGSISWMIELTWNKITSRRI